MGIAYNRRQGIVTVTADNGVTREWPLATFEADPAACVAQTGNGITPPAPVISAEEKIAALEKENTALRDALIEKGVITQAEVDAKAEEKASAEAAAEATKPK